ncbi:RbsD/FucU family protein, partial [Rhizobium ruizarguesonis]
MLKGLDPLLSPELLFTLRAMGHGDEIAIVDGNYPGVEHARRLIRLDGHHIIPVLNAVLSVLPIDDFVAEAIFRSTVKAERDKLDPVHEEMIDCCARHEPHRQVVPL